MESVELKSTHRPSIQTKPRAGSQVVRGVTESEKEEDTESITEKSSVPVSLGRDPI